MFTLFIFLETTEKLPASREVLNMTVVPSHPRDNKNGPEEWYYNHEGNVGCK